MNATALHDKEAIEAFLRQDTFLHLYGIGDLDDFFWPQTQWYGLTDRAGIKAIILLYHGFRPPVLQALAQEEKVDHLLALLRDARHVLPPRFYAHLSPAIEEVLKPTHALVHHGHHYKMALRDRSALNDVDTSRVELLTTADGDEILRLYAESYPGHWFQPPMLDTGQYFGIREEGRLVSAAGVHVFSPRYRVAALGNIVTHPAYRNRGLARAATARLCLSLFEWVDAIGLNVKADNASGIACYRKLGFGHVAGYHEWTVEALH